MPLGNRELLDQPGKDVLMLHEYQMTRVPHHDTIGVWDQRGGYRSLPLIVGDIIFADQDQSGPLIVESSGRAVGAGRAMSGCLRSC
jgi:hypothetical protein